MLRGLCQAPDNRPVGSHILRHSLATNMVRRGASLAEMATCFAIATAARQWGTSKNIRLRWDDRRLRSPRGRFNGRRPFIEAI
jgi:hypothetical protein